MKLRNSSVTQTFPDSVATAMQTFGDAIDPSVGKDWCLALIRDSLARMLGSAQAESWEADTVRVRENKNTIVVHRGDIAPRANSYTGGIVGYFRSSMRLALGRFPDVFLEHPENFDECFSDIIGEVIARAESEHDPLHEGENGARSYPVFLYGGFANSASDWARSKMREYRREMSANQFADRDGTGVGSATDTLLANNGQFVSPDHERNADREYAKSIWDKVVANMSDRDREYVTRRANGEESQVICKDLGVSNGTGTFVWQRTVATVERLTESVRS